MTGEALGGGVMVAVAAALWVAYLMPTWSRRRQYLATERNAVRLQQTLRILAETAEVPGEVRLEANARTVAAQQRLLAQAEEDARAEAKAVADAARAARRAAFAAASAARQAQVPPAALVLRRLRRWRALTSLVLLAALGTLAAGSIPAFVSGAWTVPAVGAGGVLLSLIALSRLARAARSARVITVAPVQATTTPPRFEPVQLDEKTPAAATTWTPQPLPRPLYLSPGSVAQAAMASVDAAAELKKVAAEAVMARRAAQIAAEETADVTPIPRPVTARSSHAVSTSDSRPFAQMGIIGNTAPGMSDLDAVLRRRRAVG